MSLACEQLESRVLLAANATAKLSGSGVLRISGTGSDDVIQVLIDGDEVEVFADTDGDGDGDSLGVFDGVSDIKINTKRGNDHVWVTGDVFAGDIRISTAGGNDCVFAEDLEMNGNLLIRTGGGNDLVALENITAGKVSVRTGGGNDTVTMSSTDGPVGIDANTLEIDLGGGNDIVTLIEDELDIAASLTINGGGGDDLLIAVDLDILAGLLGELGASVSVETQLAAVDAEVELEAIEDELDACIDTFDQRGIMVPV